MTHVTEWYEPLLDNGWLPHAVLRRGIRSQLQSRINEIRQIGVAEEVENKMQFLEMLKQCPIAIETDRANEQHYEVDTGVYEATLGKRMKYSCCLFPTGKETLDEAETLMLESYVEKAQLQEKQRILDLGCGWGSASLFIAKRFPQASVTALSNSRIQKSYIDRQATKKGIENLNVITGDIKDYEFPPDTFDRIISIEMFEHMKNYAFLMEKTSRWLKTNGKLFVHIFCHFRHPYDYKEGDGWMTKYFFSGGTMPSADLFLYYQQHLTIERHWLISGRHYELTCEEWLKRLVKNRKQAWPSLELTYGHDRATTWYYRWQVFYLACAEMFAWNGGNEWCVGHYLFQKKTS